MVLKKFGLFVAMVVCVWCLWARGAFAAGCLMDAGDDQEELEDRLNQAIQSAVGDRVSLLKENELLLSYCRKTAVDFLAGIPKGGDSSPWIWGAGELNTIPFVQPEEVIPKLINNLKSDVSAWMLGVAYCKNAVYQDGMYAVTLVTFSRKPSSEGLEQLIFSLLNARKKQNNQPSLIWSSLLVSQAKPQLRNFKATHKIQIPSKGFKLYYAYETPDIETIPKELLDRLERDSIREIGICVIKEKSKRFKFDAFLVSLVGN